MVNVSFVGPKMVVTRMAWAVPRVGEEVNIRGINYVVTKVRYTIDDRCQESSIAVYIEEPGHDL